MGNSPKKIIHGKNCRKKLCKRSHWEEMEQVDSTKIMGYLGVKTCEVSLPMGL